MYNPDDAMSVEKYSSAVTLSDMEVFIFPELMFSLFLANTMSPLLWRYAEDPWFRKNGKMNEYRRIQRVKQYIMDNFVFNLDLETWGLTTKQRELARFSSFIDETILSQSNALFGYEGDKYYFDIDIRRHFGLDKFTTDTIPYWKTETVEAMDAFRQKSGYPSGAGECVSLAALYAGALFVAGKVPLDKIYMMATPLHSQNFVDVRDGILTNNRRIVTKNMWFNGTELSAKARRALENERVTVVVHHTGYIHTMYEEATIAPDSYRHFSQRLQNYLKTDITFEILASFMRQNHSLQKCFQVMHSCCGKPRYIEAEKIFHYEHGSKARVGDATQSTLLHEIDEDEYYPNPLPNRIVLDEIQAFFEQNNVTIDRGMDIEKLKSHLHHSCLNVEELIADLIRFCKTEPRLPDTGKKWRGGESIEIDESWTREQVVDHLDSIRATHPIADLAFMAYRDMTRAPWKPFLKAAMERNPVSINGSADLSVDRVAKKLWTMDNTSIYEGPRPAQPDEVWNFGRGDGLEKALCLMNIMKARAPEDAIVLEGDGKTVCVRGLAGEYRFDRSKEIPLPQAEEFEF